MRSSKFQPARVLAVSFISAILLGSFLLWLPFSTTAARLSPVDAAFTAASAVCVTGLTVQDTGTVFSPVGQAVILVLIQLGGLGIITFSTMILIVAGRQISISDRITVQGGFTPSAIKDFRSLIKDIFFYTMAIELAGTILLYLSFIKRAPSGRAVVLSVFHSISAFCNAGFSLFPDNLMGYREDIIVNITVIVLIILGGLGFFVQREVVGVVSGFLKRRKRALTLHSKIVIFISFYLTVIPLAMFFLMEGSRSLRGFSLKEKIMASFFQVVTPRTAGFNTVDMTALGPATVLLLMLLMFIGASPGSTGGGVKTSTFGVVFAFLRAKFRARDKASLFRRTIPSDLVIGAFAAISLALAVAFLSSFLLVLVQPGLTIKETAFEALSALGTVGLSMGITPRLVPAAKIILIVTMYIGRIGPLILLAAFGRSRPRGNFEYVEESVMI
jgi:trk system potassium uptake protein TrkH